MSEEELELLITIDDPGELLEEDVFNHLHGQGDWICTLSKFSGTANDIEV